MKSISLNEEGLINKQIYLEEKLNEKEMKCQMILDENNKINSEYKLLNDNYIRLINNCVKWFFSTLKTMIINIKNKIENWKDEIKKKCDSY